MLSHPEVRRCIYIYKKALGRLQSTLDEQPRSSVFQREYIIAFIIARLFIDLEDSKEIESK